MLAFLGGERLKQPPLVGEVGLGDAVDQLAAFGREPDQRAAAVLRVGAALDQAGLLEPVEALRHAARG